MNQDMRVVVESLGIRDFIESLREMPASEFICCTLVAVCLFATFLALALVG